MTMLAVITASVILTVFGHTQPLGLGRIALATVVGIILGVVAQTILSNLIAGTQFALSGRLKVNDTISVEGKQGWIEQMTAVHVVVRLCDGRRTFVPLSFLSNGRSRNGRPAC